MTTPTELREAIAEKLATIPGLRALPYVPATPAPPMAAVGQWTAEYDTTLARGYDTYRFTVRLFVAPVSDRASQELLDSFCASSGTNSVKAALEADQTLGGVASTCRVVRIGPAPLVIPAGNQEFIGADIEIEVLAAG
jgi:hypothetical protein